MKVLVELCQQKVSTSQVLKRSTLGTIKASEGCSMVKIPCVVQCFLWCYSDVPLSTSTPILALLILPLLLVSFAQAETALLDICLFSYNCNHHSSGVIESIVWDLCLKAGSLLGALVQSYCNLHITQWSSQSLAGTGHGRRIQPILKHVEM